MLVTAAAYADVVAVTTVNGNVPLDLVTRNALAIVELLDWDVPVAAGAARALLSDPVDAAEVHGETGMDGVRLPEPSRRATDDAIEVIIESVRAEEGLTIVATGPLTNIALALRVASDLERRISAIHVMGGSAAEGNVTAAAEFNTYADPEAAAIVLGADCPVHLCGLDLTHQVTCDAAMSARLRSIGGPAAELVAEVVDAQLASFGTYASATDHPPLHDPVALLTVTHPHLFRSTRAPITVETGFGITRGATIVDRRRFDTVGASPSGDVRTEWVHEAVAGAVLDAIVDACRLWAPAPKRS